MSAVEERVLRARRAAVNLFEPTAEVWDSVSSADIVITARVSTAISLKRIADSLEKQVALGEAAKKTMEEGIREIVESVSGT